MTYSPITSFRRAVDAAQLKHQDQTKPTDHSVNKYEALRELTAARKSFNLSNRDLSVLQALISFRPGATLDGDNLIVHPSNASICERLNGMPCSTMRRHLSRLVDAGIILRRDSPNGKRYVRRYNGEKHAFGFDLTPLLTRFSEFSKLANDIRAKAEAMKARREAISLMRRDLAGLVAYGEETHPSLTIWDQLSDLAILTARDLRRKLTDNELQELETALIKGLDSAREVFDLGKTEKLSTKATHSEQHIQNTNKDINKSKENHEVRKHRTQSSTPPSAPLRMVLTTCTELHNYSRNKIQTWKDLVDAADFIRPMMGVSVAVWELAKKSMGNENSAIVLAAMLERFNQIKSPSAYLRHLSNKAEIGYFSTSPMLTAISGKGLSKSSQL